MTNPIEKHWRGVPYNDADKLGVTIEHAVVSANKPYAKVVVVHLLTAEENNFGNHNAYMDVIDESDKQLRNALLRGDNNGIKLAARIDKPPHEFGTNFSMFSQDTLSCWVGSIPGLDDLASDKVNGLHTRWGGKVVGGQNYGHVSFYIIWQLITKATLPTVPPIPPIPSEEDAYQKGLTVGRQEMKDQIIAEIKKL